jgi:hypothetical protein
MVTALRAYVAAVFGPTSEQYQAFGFEPPKPRAKSPIAKVIGAAKLRATRKARNTMGSKQRLGVKGTLPAQITLASGITPTVPSAAPAQPAVETVTVTASNGVASTR